jgi:hypothetical protein
LYCNDTIGLDDAAAAVVIIPVGGVAGRIPTSSRPAANSWTKESSCRTAIRSAGKSTTANADADALGGDVAVEKLDSPRWYFRGLPSATVSAERLFRFLGKKSLGW